MKSHLQAACSGVKPHSGVGGRPCCLDLGMHSPLLAAVEAPASGLPPLGTSVQIKTNPRVAVEDECSDFHPGWLLCLPPSMTHSLT